MSMWHELRETQEASVLSNKPFLSLRSCHRLAGVWCGDFGCSWDESKGVAAKNTQNNVVTPAAQRAENKEAAGRRRVSKKMM